jgi:rhodanese-related sulfurtransferase
MRYGIPLQRLVMKKTLRNIMFWVLLIVILISMGIYGNRDSNAKVDSKAFIAMLYFMLDHSISEIGVDELSEMKNITILDAREPNEFKVSHLKNAINIGYSNFTINSVSDLDKNEKIVVYCSVGKRSENIAKKLIEAGFLDVNNLYGGIFEWKNHGQPVYSGSKETEQVHAYDKFFGVWLTGGIKVFD